VFYGPDQAAIHHARFGHLAREAAHLVRAELARAGLTTGTVVDLGCGTGIFAAELAAAGYDVTGVDISEAMVTLARAHAPAATFSVGSLHDFELPPAVAVVALGEALNYATDGRAGITALEQLATRVRAALAPGGVFVFDVATPGRGGPDRRRDRFHDDENGWSLGMQSTESDDRTTLERRITIFVREGDTGYRRVDEIHTLRLYGADVVRDALVAAGYDVEVRSGYDEPAAFGGWKVFIAR
jgi:SAM-dependent methyltransferase